MFGSRYRLSEFLLRDFARIVVTKCTCISSEDGADTDEAKPPPGKLPKPKEVEKEKGEVSTELPEPTSNSHGEWTVWTYQRGGKNAGQTYKRFEAPDGKMYNTKGQAEAAGFAA